jgi:hypothetical protein
MRTRRLPAILVALTLCAAGIVAGCGSSDDSTAVSEGAPLHLGDLEYNVVITRYLNPNDTEDKSYLQGAPQLPNDENYLGVFMQVKNTGENPQTIPADMKIVDTEGDQFTPASLQNPFSLDLGQPVEGGAVVPNPESAAANGPIQGSMVLFLITQASIEDRPLELVIPSADGGAGEIQLDL